MWRDPIGVWFSALTLVLLVLSACAWAEDSPPDQQSMSPGCAPRDNVINQLRDRYGEVMVGVGLSSDRHLLMSLFHSQDGGTWTWVLNRPDGVSCILGGGTDWQDRAPNWPSNEQETEQ